MQKQPFDFLEHCYACLLDAKRMHTQATTEKERNIARAFEASLSVLIREYLSTLNEKAGY
jgi:uncharacterized protein with ATP-grasp and redox domains